MLRQALRRAIHNPHRSATPRGDGVAMSRRLGSGFSTWNKLPRDRNDENIMRRHNHPAIIRAAKTTVRHFSGKSRRGVGTLDDLDDGAQVEAESLRAQIPSATEMEFFALDNDNYFDDDDDDDDKDDESSVADAEYQRKQEEIRRELDTRTGRGWTDPWHISEEQWMSLQTADDLPEWSPEYVSRISQERVKIHPDGIPTLSVLANISLPAEACPHPGLGQTKEYAAYRKDYHYKYIEGRVFDIAPPKVDRIVKLKTWQDKQDAVDELFESVEEQLKNEEEILGLHPHFPSWIVKAVEAYLTKVQSGDLKPSIAKESEVEPVFMDCYDQIEPDEMVPSILSPLKPHPREGPGRMVEEWQLAAHKKTKRILVRAATRTIAKTLEEKEASRIFVHGRRGVGKVRSIQRRLGYWNGHSSPHFIFRRPPVRRSGIHCGVIQKVRMCRHVPSRWRSAQKEWFLYHTQRDARWYV